MGGIVFLGDSVTKATDYGGVLQVDAFPYKVGIACGYLPSEITNAGVSSNTSGMMLERIESDVIAKSPSVCVIMAMPNDVGKGVSVELYTENMQGIIDSLRAAFIRPVVASPPLARGDTANFVKYRPFLEAMELVAKKNDVPFIDCYREYAFMNLYSPTDFLSCYVDHLHQTKAGHTKIASIMTSEKFASFLAPIDPLPERQRSVRNLSVGIADYLASEQSALDLQNLMSLRETVTSRWP